MTREGRPRPKTTAVGVPGDRLVLTRIECQSEVLVVATGELASDTCDHLSRSTASATDLLLDLREVTFVDSAGLNTLLALDATASRAGRTLRIDPGTALRRLLELCGMEDMLTLVEIAEG